MEAFRDLDGWRPKVDVCVCEVLSPASFMIREAPGSQYSQSGREFLSMELKIKQMVAKWDFAPVNPNPAIGSVVLVRKPLDGEWCRARVDNIYDTTSGYQAKVTLVDFGGSFMVAPDMLRQIRDEELLQVPFQCVEFFLPGMIPRKWTIDKETITTKYMAGDTWDPAAVDYVKHAVSKATQVQVQVLGQTPSGRLYGKLLLRLNNHEVVLNDELVKQNYAFVGPAAAVEGAAPAVVEVVPMDDSREQLPALRQMKVTPAVQVLARERQAAMSAIFQEMYDFAKQPAMSGLLRIPVEMAVEEPPSETPSDSSSVSSSPTPSCASTALSVGPLSAGLTTPPTTPGLGRGLALLLTLKQLGAYDPPSRPDTPGRASAVCDSLGGRSAVDGVAAMSPPPALKSPRDTEWAPMEASAVVRGPSSLPPPSQAAGAKDVGEQKPRGRAQLLHSAVQASSGSALQGRGRPLLTEHATRPCRRPYAAAPSGEDNPAALSASSDRDQAAGSGSVLPREEATRESKQLSLGDSGVDKERAQEGAKQDSRDDRKPPPLDKASRLKALCRKARERSLVPGPTSEGQDCEPSGQRDSWIHTGAVPKLVKVSNASVSPRVLSRGLSASKTSPSSVARSQEMATPTSSGSASGSSDFGDLAALHSLGEQPVDPARVKQEADAGAFQEFYGDSETLDPVPPDSDPYAQWSGPVNFNTDYNSFSLEPVCAPVKALFRGYLKHPPWTNLDQAHFPDSVKNRLRSFGFRSPTSIQALVWPAVLGNRNVVAVGPPHSGKSFAYLVPLVSKLSTEPDYANLPQCCGPKAVVLTSSWKVAQRVFDQLQMLIDGNSGLTCDVLYAGGAEIGREEKIANGCDILVATPASFLRYMRNYDHFILSLDRCCHLILDDAERLLEKYPAEVTAMTTELQASLSRRQKSVRMTQIVVCSTRWTNSLGHFLEATPLATSPIRAINSYFEAAVYAQVRTMVSFVSRGAHRETFLGIVEGNLSKKMVVCVADRKTAVGVQQLLLKASVFSMLLFEDLTMAMIQELLSDWRAAYERSETPVLVIQDELLPLANVRDAKILVHYDIPFESKFNFGFRYSCISDNMLDPEEQNDPVRVADGPVVHMILTTKDRKLSVQLQEFLDRLGSDIPDGLKNLAAEEQLKAAMDGDVPLCPDLKSFGTCEGRRHEKRCSYRHAILPEADHPESWSHLPSEGEVRIFVTRVVSATHFFAWILQHWEVPPGAKKVDKAAFQENSELQDAMLDLAEYFSEPENHERLKEDSVVRIGQVYGLEVDVECFQRVLVLSFARVRSGTPQVTVMHMDYGGQSTVAVTRLLLLPPRLRQLRPFAVEVYCCRVQPQDGDISWTFQAGLASHQLFSRKELVGRVVLRLGNVLWLDPLVLREELRSVDVEVNAQHVRTSLIQQGWACSNPSHVENLRRLATEAGLPVPALPAEKQEHANETPDMVPSQQRTAFLEKSGYTHGYLWKVYSPSRFYVQPLKFNSCLDSLEDEMTAAVKAGKLKRMQSAKVGDTCLARLADSSSWYRAEVRKVLDGGQVEVHFPDYGDSSTCSLDEVYQSEPWMLLLPYQGVECCLAGVRPPGSDPSEAQWDPRACGVLEDFGFDDSNVSQILCLLVAGTSEANGPGAIRHEVFLFDSCEPKRVNVAEKLIQLGLAVATDPPQPEFDPEAPHEQLSLEDDDVASTVTLSDSGDEIDRQCEENLREHMSTVYSEIRDKVLVPAAQELLGLMVVENKAVEPAAGPVGLPEAADGPQTGQGVTLEAGEPSRVAGLPQFKAADGPPAGHGTIAETGEPAGAAGLRLPPLKAADGPQAGQGTTEEALKAANGPQAGQRHRKGTTGAPKEATRRQQPPTRLAFAERVGTRVRAYATWWQDDNFVYLDVLVRAPAKYTLTVCPTAIYFMVRNGGEHEFVVQEKLFAAINCEKCHVRKRPNMVEICMAKDKAKLVWNYLLRRRQKVPHIKFNLDHLVISDDDEEEDDKSPVPTGYVRPKNILPYDPVAHDERALEIDAIEEHVHDPIEDMYHSLDPNNIFEG